MRIIRILGSVLLLVAVVAAIAFACLTMFVDPNKLKPLIAAEAMKRTGYQLTIDGDLSWSFFPHMGVKVAHMSLSEPNHSPFVELDGVTIASNLAHLLNGSHELTGEVFVSSMQLFKLRAKQGHIGLHWQDGMITFDPISAKLYNGTLKGLAHGRNLSKEPLWDWSLRADNVELKSLLQDANGANSKVVLAGIGKVSTNAQTHGKSKEQIFSNLNGTCEFDISKGAIEGIDINYLVKAANALLSEQPVVLPDRFERTEFQQFTGTANIKNGVAENSNLLVSSEAFTMTGAGSIDLVRQNIDYKLQITPLQSGKAHWTIPVLIDGSLQGPAVRLDSEAIRLMIAKEQLQKVKSKVEEEVKKLPEKADKLIKKFLGN